MSRSRSIAGPADRGVSARRGAIRQAGIRLSMRASIALIGGLSLLLWIAALEFGRYVLE